MATRGKTRGPRTRSVRRSRCCCSLAPPPSLSPCCGTALGAARGLSGGFTAKKSRSRTLSGTLRLLTVRRQPTHRLLTRIYLRFENRVSLMEM